MFPKIYRQLSNSSDIGADVLRVLVYNYTQGETLLTVTFRVDFTDTSNITAEELKEEFIAGLTKDVNRLEPSSIVIIEGKQDPIGFCISLMSLTWIGENFLIYLNRPDSVSILVVIIPSTVDIKRVIITSLLRSYTL